METIKINGLTMNAAHIAANQQLHLIRKLPNSPFNVSPQGGYMRGIDFYPQPELINPVTLSMAAFANIHGHFPNLITPFGLNEKIVWSKFFREFKVPESGNKLATSSFIPEKIKGEIKCAKVLWQSAENTLPKNDEIEPGFYYLKANHGSSMFERISYPLSEEERSRLESIAKVWLNRQFGFKDGEWWYCVFPKRIFLEQEIITPENSISWMFYVTSGLVAFIALYRKTDTGDEATWLDDRFNLLPFQNPKRHRVKNLAIDDSLKAKLLSLSIAIGSQFHFARVDFLLDKNNVPFLGEVTFTPGNGLTERPSVLDLLVGEQWRLPS